jgi:hypothetical protein
MATHLGKLSFLETPDVNGEPLLTGQVGSVLSGPLANRPTAGVTNRLFIDSTNHTIWQDNGSTWILVSAPIQTANETTINGHQVGLAPNLIMPGSEGFVPPVGTTAQRSLTPSVGEHRYNSTLLEPEVFSNGAWLPYARVIQSVAGPINATTSSVAGKATTTVPTATEGFQIWTQSFTPLVTGSSLVIQFTISAYTTATARSLFSTAFAGTTCIGMVVQHQAVTAATFAVGVQNLAMQAVYTAPSTAAITFSARLGHLNTSTAAVTMGVNQGTSGSYGSAMVTEYRILEII